MKKILITILLIITCVICISPINTKALEIDNTSIVTQIGSNIVTDNIYMAVDACEESEAILGDVNCEDSVAWLLQLLLNIVKVAGPILVVILSSIDFVMVIIKSDNDQFQKAQKKLITRLVLAILLFLIPVIVQILLQVFGITGDITGGIQ